MKRCLIFGFAALCIVSCGPAAGPLPKTSTSVEIIQKPDGLIYAKDHPTPYTGEVVTFTQGSSRQSLEIYQDGKPHGAWQRYWSNGQLKREEKYELGSKTHQRQWYEDGTLKGDAEMKNGVGFGKIRLWWPDGRLRRTSLIGAELKPHGHVLEYAQDGSILTDAIFAHGVYISGKLREEPLATSATAQAH